MIGQTKNLEFIHKCAGEGNLPRFIIITGAKGSGKRTMAKYIAKHCLGAYPTYPDLSVDGVRRAIENSYKCGICTAYIFPNADNMHAQAKNALLKITEEPPREAYFIMTLESINNTLDTLKSRATEIAMQTYSREELKEFKYPQTPAEELALNMATTPGQYEELLALDATKFYAFCEKVLNNIATVTGVNAFKIANNFKFKEDGEGYDPILFFDCLQYVCIRQVTEAAKESDIVKVLRISKTVKCISKYKTEMRKKGIKKDSTFDMWILEMRDIWKEIE